MTNKGDILKAFKDCVDKIEYNLKEVLIPQSNLGEWFEPKKLEDQFCPVCGNNLYDMMPLRASSIIECKEAHFSYASLYNYVSAHFDRDIIINGIAINSIDHKEIFDTMANMNDKEKNEHLRKIVKLGLFI